MAKRIKNTVPIVYATANISSLARIAKIKLNENSKTQAFWNYFPEMNHNEMLGFTNLVMDPYFLVFESQFAHPRNKKRIKVFKKLFEKRGLPVEVMKLQGDNVMEEILGGYYFMDHMTYYLAEEYDVDPEPVALVEDFKKML